MKKKTGEGLSLGQTWPNKGFPTVLYQAYRETYDHYNNLCPYSPLRAFVWYYKRITYQGWKNA